ncbi:MAG: aminotransferase class I/II-fold pyridoxal phosphate-dependent enzyme, partial [Calditrichaeota bacterium]|nr:aminotransferase class I/II-fold pyridoxal phosphate-dependent enzyme [Calditrichota bacterium]MCB0315363.1 aminotransferase class I/II-fold pyridoxal phosphate-dependent enzyme [Calditrichota bacterium]
MIATASRLEQISEYYFSAKLQEVRRLVAQGKDIINLGIGNPDLPPSPETIAVLGTAAREDGNHGYQPYRGIPELRSAMAAWYRRTYGVTLDPDRQVLPLMGSKEGIFHIAMAFLNPGD